MEHAPGGIATKSIVGLLVPLIVFAVVMAAVSDFFVAVAGRAGGSMLSLAAGLLAAMLWIIVASVLIGRGGSSE